MRLKPEAIWGMSGKRHTEEEDGMGRKFIDCREYPSEMNCTVAFSADSDEELLECSSARGAGSPSQGQPGTASANQEFVQGGHTAHSDAAAFRLTL
jgi:hypothetical protein